MIKMALQNSTYTLVSKKVYLVKIIFIPIELIANAARPREDLFSLEHNLIYRLDTETRESY